MRIAIVSDSMRACTGFGKQTRLLAVELFQRGHEVIVVARPPVVSFCSPDDSEHLNLGPTEVLVENFFEPTCIESTVRELRPDLTLIFRNSRYLLKFVGTPLLEGGRTLLWYADESEALRHTPGPELQGLPDRSVIAVSHAVASMLPEAKVAGVLHHGVNFDSLPVHTSRSALRQKWNKALGCNLSESDIVILCADRNDVRKNWDATYALFRRIRELLSGHRLMLIQVTSRTAHEPFFDLAACGLFYGVSDFVVDVPSRHRPLFDDELYELILASDLRISCSGSEGFGLLSLETAALKVPQVSVKLRALTEFLGPNNPSLVEPIRLAMYPQDAFYYASKVYAVPDIDAMAQRAARLLTDEFFRASAIESSYQACHLLCNSATLADRFLAFAAETVTRQQVIGKNL